MNEEKSTDSESLLRGSKHDRLAALESMPLCALVADQAMRTHVARAIIKRGNFIMLQRHIS